MLCDLAYFIDDSKMHPEKYMTPFAEFSSAQYTTNPPVKTVRYGFPKKIPENFYEWLNGEFTQLPDALTIPEIIHITGYCDNSVDRWIRNGWLRSAQTQSGKIIAKDWLIDFYCGYGYSVAKMSEKHINLMLKYFGEQ